MTSMRVLPSGGANVVVVDVVARVDDKIEDDDDCSFFVLFKR